MMYLIEAIVNPLYKFCVISPNADIKTTFNMSEKEAIFSNARVHLNGNSRYYLVNPKRYKIIHKFNSIEELKETNPELFI